MSGKPSSTIGFERRHNEALLDIDRNAFVDAIAGFLPPKPSGYVETVLWNRGATMSSTERV
jgi:hypothetical protein